MCRSPPSSLRRSADLSVLSPSCNNLELDTFDNTIAQHQHVDVPGCGGPDRLIRRRDDGFTRPIERGVDQHRASSYILEGTQQGM